MVQTMSGYSVIDSYGDALLVSNPIIPLTNGTRVMGGLRKGSVATCLLYIARRWHQEVERIVQSQGVWGYDKRTIRLGQAMSNHSAGAAMDLNAVLHPQGRAGTLSDAQIQRVASIESAVGSAFNWGGRFTGSYVDAMHWQVRDGHAGAPVDKLAGELAGYPIAPAPTPAGRTPAYPFTQGDGRYFGPVTGPAQSISGQTAGDAIYRPALAAWQTRATLTGHNAGQADGMYGPQTRSAALGVQSAARLATDGLIGYQTWSAVWALPVGTK